MTAAVAHEPNSIAGHNRDKKETDIGDVDQNSHSVRNEA